MTIAQPEAEMVRRPPQRTPVSASPAREGCPRVSVCMTTYNHRKYLAEAIGSVLMQRVSFPVEIILHDDCSTDGTTDVVRHFSAKYPMIIRPIYQDENQYSQGRKPMLSTFLLARGEYIAWLEGDDAWADPGKLSRQVDFLEENEDFVLCYGNARIVDEEGKEISGRKVPEESCRTLTSEEMVSGRYTIPTSTVMFRNHRILSDLPPQICRAMNGDTFLFSLLGQFGMAGFIDFSPSAYRQHSGGVYSSLREDERRRRRLLTFLLIHQCVGKEFRECVGESVFLVLHSNSEWFYRSRDYGGLLCTLFRSFWFALRNVGVRNALHESALALRYISKAIKRVVHRLN